MAGLALAAALTRLAIAAVQAGATLQAPRPPLVAVSPWAQLTLGALALLAVFGMAGMAGCPAALVRHGGNAMSAMAVDVRDVFCVHRTAHGDAAALQGLNLRLRHGERVCVLGPSGAGKTTLLRVLAGLQIPSAGSVLVFGTDIGRQPPRKRARLRHRLIGFLDQRSEATLPPDLPIADAVALPLALRGARRADRRARVTALLHAAGLGDRARRAARASCPAGNASARPCAPRWPIARRCCWPTSRRRSSTRPRPPQWRR